MGPNTPTNGSTPFSHCNTATSAAAAADDDDDDEVAPSLSGNRGVVSESTFNEVVLVSVLTLEYNTSSHTTTFDVVLNSHQCVAMTAMTVTAILRPLLDIQAASSKENDGSDDSRSYFKNCCFLLRSRGYCLLCLWDCGCGYLPRRVSQAMTKPRVCLRTGSPDSPPSAPRLQHR